jgi:uncharacterized coiled-coil DUF342 family protein
MTDNKKISIIEEINLLFTHYTVYEALKHSESNKLNQYKDQPKKPRLPVNHTHADILKYADETVEYDRLYAEYKERAELTKQHNEAIDQAIVDNIKRVSGISKLPEPVQSELWQWIDNMTSGYYETYTTAESLCDILAMWPTPKTAM